MHNFIGSRHMGHSNLNATPHCLKCTELKTAMYIHEIQVKTKIQLTNLGEPIIKEEKQIVM